MDSKSWMQKSVNLPEYLGKKIILVPTKIVSGSRAYSNHYNWFISRNYISNQLISGKRSAIKNPKMISILSDGSKKAIIKEIYKTFKKPKEELIDFVKDFNGSLDEFLLYAKENYPELNLGDLSNE
jgi:hypothetical protein